MEEEISLKELYQIVNKHFLTIVIAIVTGIIISVLAMIFLVTPKYNSEAQLLVNQQSESAQTQILTSEIQSNIQMINTYRDIITGHSVLTRVNESLGNKYTIAELQDSITVDQGQNSQAFKVTAVMGTAQEAQLVLTELLNTFETTIGDIYGNSGTSIFVLSPATYNPYRVSPRLIIFILIGAVIGLAISILIIIVMELMDTTVKEDDYLVQLGLINLGHVYELSSKELKQSRLSANKGQTKARERV